VPILVFLGLSILELGPMYVTDRQTDVRQIDVRQKHRLILPPYDGGGITELNNRHARLSIVAAISATDIIVIMSRPLGGGIKR